MAQFVDRSDYKKLVSDSASLIANPPSGSPTGILDGVDEWPSDAGDQAPQQPRPTGPGAPVVFSN